MSDSASTPRDRQYGGCPEDIPTFDSPDERELPTEQDDTQEADQ